ncbi:caprin-2 [Chanos chanos]|uniref:Caprin-2 n=1 Tax=Chanos chanos TaxID=29144 RepID=A0A6J2V7P1_CHACN|nr:caprin-2 [Chanos chanos]
MVQLSSSQALDESPPPETCTEGEVGQGSPKLDSPRALASLQLSLNPSFRTYPGYETYIEDGLICLKHKIRNIEKKKLKLEEYKRRLQNGDSLNQDQLDAVGRYEEVIHNLSFAKELHKTLSVLTQDLLKAQRKAVRREEAMKVELEQRRLSMVLQVQYILRCLQQEHVRKELISLHSHSHFLSAQELKRLLDLSALLGCQRDESMSLEEQMEQASYVYLELLEGKDKPVVGSTYKHMKEQLLRLMDCGFFDHVLVPACESLKEAETKKSPSKGGSLSAMMKLKSNEVPSREFLNRRYLPDTDATSGHGQDADDSPPSWKAEFLALKDQEPPDSWDMEFTEKPVSPEPGLQKPWRGAAGFILKIPVTVKKSNADQKQKRQKRTKDGQMDGPVEMLGSLSSLPEDPALRKQQLEDLMDQIRGSFNFMQDSLLDSEASQSNVCPGMGHPAPSTPISSRLLPGEQKTSLTNGEQSMDGCELNLSAEELQQCESEDFSSPPLYNRKSSLPLSLEEDTTRVGRQSPCNGAVPPSSVPAQVFSTPPSGRSISMASTAPFHNVHSVMNPPVSSDSDSDPKADMSNYTASSCLTYSTASTLSYSTASTQTPPDEDSLQPEVLYQAECQVSNDGQLYSTSGQSRLGQPYYSRGTVRGGYEGFRTGLRSPGGSYIPQSHSMRETASVLYATRETGYQQGYKRGGSTGSGQRNNSSAGWSDSSQVSSPDREGTYMVDSGHGTDSTLSISPMELPVTPQGPHTLMPVHVYPLSQQMRVAFSAARTANFAPGTLNQPITFDLLHSNLGDMFDMLTGRFSCPVAGTYVFFFHILKLAINVPLYVNLMRNEEVMVSAYANDGAPDHETASNHAVLQLYQGDQVWLRLHRGAIYSSSWKYSTFSGFLLYQG